MASSIFNRGPIFLDPGLVQLNRDQVGDEQVKTKGAGLRRLLTAHALAGAGDVHPCSAAVPQGE